MVSGCHRTLSLLLQIRIIKFFLLAFYSPCWVFYFSLNVELFRFVKHLENKNESLCALKIYFVICIANSSLSFLIIKCRNGSLRGENCSDCVYLENMATQVTNKSGTGWPRRGSQGQLDNGTQKLSINQALTINRTINL